MSSSGKALSGPSSRRAVAPPPTSKFVSGSSKVGSCARFAAARGSRLSAFVGIVGRDCSRSSSEFEPTISVKCLRKASPRVNTQYLSLKAL